MNASHLPQFSSLKCRFEHGVVEATLNRRHALNAIDTNLLIDLHRFFDYLMSPERRVQTIVGNGVEDPVRIVILRGAKAFCSGVDIKAAALGIGSPKWNYKNILSQELLASVVEKIRLIPQPVICVVNGPCVGLGLCLACACDIR